MDLDLRHIHISKMDLYLKDIESRFKGYPYFQMDLDLRISLFSNGSRYVDIHINKWI